MKTITQYREEIKSLRKAAGDISAKAVNENRDLLDSEVSVKNEILDKIEELEKIVAVQEREERIAARLEGPQNPPATKPGPQATKHEGRPQDRFGSFGEQLAAVVNAGRPGGSTDPRLLNIRGAASGMSESVPSDGGFIVQQDFSTELLQDAFATGILSSRCRRQPISGSSNSIKINGVDETSRASSRYGGIVGYWSDEAGEKTKSAPKFRKIELNLKKLVGLCYLTDELLEDAPALDGFVREAFPGEFGFLLDDAIVNGSGVGQPLGILNAGCLVSVAAETGQTAATILAENIDKMFSRRFASQTGNYIWLYNQTIEPQLSQLVYSVGTGGVPVYLPPGGLSNAPYGQIKGRPAMAIEQCAALGTVGDLILANFPNGYVLAEKGGIKADMSIHVRFVNDESVLRFVLRVDGQPVRASALTPYKGGASATQSHFIALATRA
jgi:HK97 family phage major capsid protein